MGCEAGLRGSNQLNKCLCQISKSRKVGSTKNPQAVAVKFGDILKRIVLAISIVTSDCFQLGQSPLISDNYFYRSTTIGITG